MFSLECPVVRIGYVGFLPLFRGVYAYYDDRPGWYSGKSIIRLGLLQFYKSFFDPDFRSKPKCVAVKLKLQMKCCWLKLANLFALLWYLGKWVNLILLQLSMTTSSWLITQELDLCNWTYVIHTFPLFWRSWCARHCGTLLHVLGQEILGNWEVSFTNSFTNYISEGIADERWWRLSAQIALPSIHRILNVVFFKFVNNTIFWLIDIPWQNCVRFLFFNWWNENRW